MKKSILWAIALVTLLVSLGGCFYGHPGDRGDRYDRGRGDRHDQYRDGDRGRY